MLFEVMTGGWRYTCTNRQDLLAKVLTGVLERHPAMREVDIPAWLDTIVARALAHRREDRFASAAEMRAAFEPHLAPTRPSLLRRMFRRT